MIGTVRLFAGARPSARLARELQDEESCFARFTADPQERLWVCARVGRRVFSAVLGTEEEWVQPGGGSLFLDARPRQVTRRVAKAA